MRRLVCSFHMTERSVGSVVEVFSPTVVRRIDLSATLGFFMNMRRSFFAVFEAAKFWGHVG